MAGPPGRKGTPGDPGEPGEPGRKGTGEYFHVTTIILWAQYFAISGKFLF